MVNNWEETALGDVFKVNHGFAFKGEYFTEVEKKTVLVTPGNFAAGGGFQNQKPKYYDGPYPEDYVLTPGQVVITMTDLSKGSDTLGYAAIIPDDGNIWLHNQRIGLVELLDESRADLVFINYLLRTHEYRSWIIGSASGTTVKHTSPGRIEKYRCRIPPLHEQRAIAHILGSLDDKIELNRQMAQTLESIARAIFKSWFVDFDPVKAKMEGKQPEGMTEEIAALFPDRLVDSELGMIPEGWEYKALGDMINIFDSKRIPLSRSQRKARQGKYPYYGATSIMDYVDDYIFDGVYVLIGEDGSVKKPDGTPFLQYVSGKIWVNNHAHVIQGKRLVTSEYIYLFLSRFNIGPFITGAVQPKLNQGNLKLIPIISPDDKIMELFNETISIVFKKIICLQKECKTLQGLRDTLLPQLISGKIRVNQPEDAAA